MPLAASAESLPQFLCEAAELVCRTLSLRSVVVWRRDRANGQFPGAAAAGDDAAVRCLVEHDHDPAGILDTVRFVARLHRRWKQCRPHETAGPAMAAASIDSADDFAGAIAVCSDHPEAARIEPVIEGVAVELSLLVEPVARAAADCQSARFGEATLQFSSEAVIVTDVLGNCTRWNTAAQSMFGWPECDMLARPVPIAASRSRDEFWATLRRCVSERSPEGSTLYGQRWDGAPLVMAVRFIPLLDQQQRTSEVLLLVSDQTHFATLEQQLRLELDASVILARADSFHSVTPQLASVVGRRLQCEIVEFWETAGDDSAWRLAAAWSQDSAVADSSAARQPARRDEVLRLAFRSQEIVSVDVEGSVIGKGQLPVVAGVGELHWIAVPVPAPDGGAVVLVLSMPENGGPPDVIHRTLVSLTKRFGEALSRDRMKSQLRESEESLRQTRKMEAVGMLAGGIAHDFNNLLTVVLGNCELLLESDALDPQSREFLDEIQTAGLRAAALTRQLLMFSRKRAPLPALIDLRRQIRESCSMLKRVVGEHVALETRIAPETHPVHIDPIEFEQILLNLVVNARDAMPHGGNVTISTSNVTFRARDVTHRPGVQPGEFVAISVADAGCGMDEKTRARIFEPFFTTKDPGRGTGMGLATVYGIVSRCRGFIDVISRPGAGTRFTIHLPRAAIGIAPRQISDRPTLDPRGSETILVVEDEDVLRNLIRRILEVHGYTVVVAGTGAAALETVQQNSRIDLILSDVVMPEMDGITLTNRLREQGSRIPVLLMSGYLDVAESSEAAESQFQVLAKPFTSDVLVRAVRDALNSSPAPLPS